jgi:hypothetical protein
MPAGLRDDSTTTTIIGSPNWADGTGPNQRSLPASTAIARSGKRLLQSGGACTGAGDKTDRTGGS